MANAVQTATTAAAVLASVTNKGVYTVTEWVREFPELMYVGIEQLNMFADGGKIKNGQLSYAAASQMQFKKLGSIEADMTVAVNEVTWYEAGVYAERALLTANVTAATALVVEAANIGYFAVDDVIIIRAKSGGSTANFQTTITAINTGTNTITVTDPITAVIGDAVIFAYNLISYKSEINRTATGTSVTPVRTYFQRFGGSAEFDTQDINQTRLLVDAQNYVSGKMGVITNVSNNNFARAFYLGRNIAGVKSETQGLDAVITESEARFGVGSSIINFSGISGKAKIKKLVEVLNLASSAPVYTGTQVPTVFVNHSFITELAEMMFDLSNFYTLKDNEVTFGLTVYTSPYFRNVEFIVSSTLNKIEPVKPVAYVFPKHMVTFKTPEYQVPNEQGIIQKATFNGYKVLKLAQTSTDYVKYTMQLTIANIFAGQSFKSAYLKIINFDA